MFFTLPETRCWLWTFEKDYVESFCDCSHCTGHLDNRTWEVTNRVPVLTLGSSSVPDSVRFALDSLPSPRIHHPSRSTIGEFSTSSMTATVEARPAYTTPRTEIDTSKRYLIEVDDHRVAAAWDDEAERWKVASTPVLLIEACNRWWDGVVFAAATEPDRLDGPLPEQRGIDRYLDGTA